MFLCFNEQLYFILTSGYLCLHEDKHDYYWPLWASLPAENQKTFPLFAFWNILRLVSSFGTTQVKQCVRTHAKTCDHQPLSDSAK